MLALLGAIGCSSAPVSVCGELSGAVSAVITNCAQSSALYDSASDRTTLEVTAEGTDPVAGKVALSFGAKGAPAVGTYHDGDPALAFAQVLFKTSDRHEYDADYGGATGNGVGHLIVSIKSTSGDPGFFELHGSVDAATLQDSAGPVCNAHLDF